MRIAAALMFSRSRFQPGVLVLEPFSLTRILYSRIYKEVGFPVYRLPGPRSSIYCSKMIVVAKDRHLEKHTSKNGALLPNCAL